MTLDWEEFLDPYIQTVGELKINYGVFASNIVSKIVILRLNLLRDVLSQLKVLRKNDFTWCY